MNTATMKPGDIVKVDDGLVWFAEIVDRNPLKVRALRGDRHTRRVTPRQIVGHYRKSKATEKYELMQRARAMDEAT